jgi:predicted RNA polymerase sigma factor
MSRLETLRRIAATRPQDPFPRYGLAMELRRTGANEDALVEFAELERAVPDYVPQYLMHGQLLAELARIAEARSVFERGIAQADRKHDAHAVSELRSALESLAL